MNDRAKEIRNAIWRELEEWNLSAMQINSGRCEEFGYAVKERLEPEIQLEVVGPEIEADGEQWDRVQSKYAGHLWLYDPLGQRFYDAENAEGVDNWKNLNWFSHVTDD